MWRYQNDRRTAGFRLCNCMIGVSDARPPGCPSSRGPGIRDDRARSSALPVPIQRLAVVALVAGAADAAGIDLSACAVAAVDGRQEVAALCGTLAVPLDPRSAGGEAVELFVAVVEASAGQASPDPLVVLASGPGDAATRRFVATERGFSRILRYRDVVLVDQRGTGRSAPLRCDGSRYAALLAGGDVRSAVDAGIACLGQLRHDPRFFTTSVAVADLERVRAALGYEQLNLYGVSYGTRVAQHYLRRHPARVRSVVLEGILPPDAPLGPDLAVASQTALDALFERCAADDACGTAFPDIGRRFAALLGRLSASPAALTLEHPRTGEPETVVLTRWLFARLVRLMLASSHGASLVPVVVDAAYAGDYRGLATQALLRAENMAELAMGVNYAVLCTEDAPFYGDVDPVLRAGTFAGSALVDIVAGVCEHWPSGLLDDDLRQPLAGATPVLVLSGEFDPVAPPRLARRAVARLTNVVHVVGRGRAHDMLQDGCAQRLMATFVETADPDSLDLDCVDRSGPFPPFASRMGPGP